MPLACSGWVESHLADEREQHALARARTIHKGMRQSEVESALGAPTYRISSDRTGSTESAVRIDTGHVSTGTAAQIQGQYGCRTITNWRSAGAAMWTYDLETTVRLCVYLDEGGTVAATRVLWH
jgi:hypothetical protein